MELYFPPEGTPDYTWAEYQLEKKLGTYPGSEGSFCRTFMEAVEREIQKHLGSRSLRVDTSLKGFFRDAVEIKDQLTGHERGKSKVQYGHMIEVCDHQNFVFDNCRKKINEVMVEFLMENDGVIDRWPATNDAVGISTKHDPLGPDADPLEFPFEYFGSKFLPAGYNVYREQGNTPTWKKQICGPSSTEELSELWDRYKELDKQYHLEEGTRDFIGILKSACYLLVPILTAVFLVFSLIWYFMGVNPTAQTVEWFQAAESVLPKFLLFVPKWLLSALAVVSALLRMNPIVFWVGTPLVTLLGGLASVSILSRPYAMPVKKSVLAQSKAASRQAWAEFRATEDAWQAISDTWNQAYLEHCRNHR